MGRYDHAFSISFVHVFLCCSIFLFPLVLSQLSKTQMETMGKLSELLNGSVPTWDIKKEPNPCLWDGVNCNPSNSSVVEISLSGNSLSSTDFLSVLCRVDSLETIDVSHNLLSSIPDEFITGCGMIGTIKLLNFSRNGLSGFVPTFHGFSGLEHLDLSFNSFDGNIHLQFDGFVSLKSLNLSNNHLSGSIPINLGKAKVLEQLELADNFFNGSIPSEIVSYTDLTMVDLSANQLSGSIPDEIEKLSKLETLILSSNKLSGQIPVSLSKTTTITRFAANENEFTGFIPKGITKFLRSLDLSYNNLRGTIPSDLLSPLQLLVVDLSNNGLTGKVPSNLSVNLVRLRLGNNNLNGTIPSARYGNLKKLVYLELEANKLVGSVPPQLGLCQTLALLNLAQNELSGTLPLELGNLANLQVLKLQMNKFVGQIPTQISQLQKLATLNFSSNSLNGSIPSSISNLRNLTNLNLQKNNLIGAIPASIGSMDALIELQLGENQLSGEIPKMPSGLQIALNLSSNLFEGTIPSNLYTLTKLEVLDLSNNKFSGVIPDFLTKMQTLTQLILSNNLLSGAVPKFGSWVKLDYSGNKVINITTPPNISASKKNKYNTVAVAVSISVAAAVVGILAILAISISRRYYRVKDERSQIGDDFQLPPIIQGALLTPNAIHRSNIDFSKGIEADSDMSNIVLKTRFSTYYKATMPSGTTYLVKRLNWIDRVFPLGNHDKFGRELELLGKLNNSNIMTPLAYVLSLDSAYIFYEFPSEGSLFDVLHGSCRNVLDWGSRYSIAVGVAQGLAFLHGCNSGPIVLLDFSSRSILLKSLKEPLVGDIELLKVIDPSKSTGSLSTVAGSVGYIPPEYAYTMRVTAAGNIYSFGVVLLELLTGKPAVTDGTELVKWVSRFSNQQDHILDYSISRTSPAVKSQMLAVLKVALSCVSLSPETRPKMKSVLRMLLNAR